MIIIAARRFVKFQGYQTNINTNLTASIPGEIRLLIGCIETHTHTHIHTEQGFVKTLGWSHTIGSAFVLTSDFFVSSIIFFFFSSSIFFLNISIKLPSFWNLFWGSTSSFEPSSFEDVLGCLCESAILDPRSERTLETTTNECPQFNLLSHLRVQGKWKCQLIYIYIYIYIWMNEWMNERINSKWIINR